MHDALMPGLSIMSILCLLAVASSLEQIRYKVNDLRVHPNTPAATVVLLRSKVTD